MRSQAIKNAGIAPGKIIVVGFDASPATRSTAILAGDAGRRRSPSSRPRWARSGIETAYKAAKGETVEANVDTGTEMVTKDNADRSSSDPRVTARRDDDRVLLLAIAVPSTSHCRRSTEGATVPVTITDLVSATSASRPR